jgi:zinc/manganese transport system permease protein
MADLHIDLLLVPFLAGLLVLATHVPLGRMVLDRGIVFIDLAIAQVAGLGVLLAHFLGWEESVWAVQMSAVAAALIGAAFLIWSEERFAVMQEAVIGVVFVFAASAELILLGFDAHGAEHLKDLLVGQILWVEPPQLVPVAILYAAVLAILYVGDLRRRRGLFYAVFAVTVTASVQLVGVYLVFSSLIVPALAARNFPARARLGAAYAIGLIGYALGLVASALVDIPTGAAIVCTLIAVAVLMPLLVKVGRPWRGGTESTAVTEGTDGVPELAAERSRSRR